VSFRVIEGDCVEQMRMLEAGSVDSIVTDPPYGLKFMGKAWDDAGDGAQQQEWHHRWAVEALRVLKPGGHLLAFGGSRTYHRLASAVEDAGFEIRDQIMWLYGSGFPKSLNVSKAIDREAGAERAVVGKHREPATRIYDNLSVRGDVDLTAPATAAAAWDGWGTALKPAHEPIVVARKPLAERTVAAQVLVTGTGALNIDGCRVGAGGGTAKGDVPTRESNGIYGNGINGGGCVPLDAGRWPANVILDEEAGRLLDEQSGERPGGQFPAQRGVGKATGFGAGLPTPGGPRAMGDSGGASRFFYTAKAGKGERNAGLDGFEDAARRNAYGDGLNGPRPHTAVDYEFQPRDVRNGHPTVKPIELMRYLCRLVTPKGGLVLDPFTGSGTTGCAAVQEGFEFIGIEREPEYLPIARARITYWAREKALEPKQLWGEAA